MATSEELYRSKRGWWRSGEPWIWMNATAVALCLAALLFLLSLIAWRGFAHFWPADVTELTLTAMTGPSTIIGEISQREHLSRAQFAEAKGAEPALLPDQIERWLIKQGNRRVAPPDFRWINAHDITSQRFPAELWVIERLEWGNAYGYLHDLYFDDHHYSAEADQATAFALAQAHADTLRKQLERLEQGEFSEVNEALDALRLSARRKALQEDNRQSVEEMDASEQEQAELSRRFALLSAELAELRSALARDTLTLRLANGQLLTIPVSDVVRGWQPNRMSVAEKLTHYVSSLWLFLTEAPREANTEGGIFPAIFGTVLMVLLMALLVTPFGVVAAVYLHEYAKQGPFVQLLRIAVNNLAGVPSIVYGVFGLGFFVYFLGGSIDRLFFPEALPAPTFGTPGLLWASLTLALLTVPVVIVATEEGLSRIPTSLREGSLALGATKAETLFRLVLPVASPSILTGVILAVARAAGEVAPLMLVGVVKLAPSLPVDSSFPYLHLDRKFMHLGFHIYDVGFQSPNVEAARPLVFATTLLLVLIVLSLNLLAIVLRSRLETRYRGGDE